MSHRVKKNVLEIISNKLKNLDNIIVFDVGANLGHYSNMVNEVFGNKVKIFAFEPSEKTFSQMVDNIKYRQNIYPYNFGFGNSNTKTKLYTNSDYSGLASVYKRNLQHFNINIDQEEIIEIKTIDDFCSENIGGGHIHFLKIDVEGHELKVLDGAKKTIDAKRIDFIQFEFGGCNIDSRTYLRFLVFVKR